MEVRFSFRGFFFCCCFVDSERGNCVLWWNELVWDFTPECASQHKHFWDSQCVHLSFFPFKAWLLPQCTQHKTCVQKSRLKLGQANFFFSDSLMISGFFFGFKGLMLSSFLHLLNGLFLRLSFNNHNHGNIIAPVYFVLCFNEHPICSYWLKS